MNQQLLQEIKTRKLHGATDEEITQDLLGAYSVEEISNGLSALQYMTPASPEGQNVPAAETVRSKDGRSSTSQQVVYAIAFVVASYLISYLARGIIQMIGPDILRGGDAGLVATINIWGYLVSIVVGFFGAALIFRHRIEPVFVAMYGAAVAIQLLQYLFIVLG